MNVIPALLTAATTTLLGVFAGAFLAHRQQHDAWLRDRQLDAYTALWDALGQLNALTTRRYTNIVPAALGLTAAPSQQQFNEAMDHLDVRMTAVRFVAPAEVIDAAVEAVKYHGDLANEVVKRSAEVDGMQAALDEGLAKRQAFFQVAQRHLHKRRMLRDRQPDLYDR